MKEIDEAVVSVLEPLVFGRSSVLSRSDTETVSRWATKTALVRALYDHDDRSYEPSAELLAYFYASRQPVFDGAVQIASAVGVGGTWHSADIPSRATAASVHVVTLVVGAVAVQCALAPVGDDEDQAAERDAARRYLLASRVISKKRFQLLDGHDVVLGRAVTEEQLSLVREIPTVLAGQPTLGTA